MAGRRCLDAGASTGGFTDCLLQAGAAHVVAADVAYGELHWRLRTDPRVTVLERVNVRGLAPRHFPTAPDLIVADLSFIWLEKVLPALAACAAAVVRPAGAGEAAVRAGPGPGRQGRGGALRGATGWRRSSSAGDRGAGGSA